MTNSWEVSPGEGTDIVQREFVKGVNVESWRVTYNFAEFGAGQKLAALFALIAAAGWLATIGAR